LVVCAFCIESTTMNRCRTEGLIIYNHLYSSPFKLNPA
jgi:hypothetical protein